MTATLAPVRTEATCGRTRVERIKLNSFAPHRLRYEFVEETGLFHHNIERDLNFFVLWEKGRWAEKQITQSLRERFSLLYVAEIEWSEPHIFRNFSRLYDRPEIEKARKAISVGGGPFLLFVVCDNNPRYVFDRSVSGDIEIINANVAASKRQFRNMFGGKYLVHSSNNIREFFEQAILLLGQKRLEQIFDRDTWDGEVHSIRQDLAGSEGWADFIELFAVLNYSSNYLVLRNFECFPQRFFDGEKDIDILCDRLSRFASAANASKRGTPDKLSKLIIKVAGRDVPVDARFVGDGYYHELWQTAMLGRKKSYRGMVFTPRQDDYFFSLLYHGKIQKAEIKAQYVAKLENLARNIGMDWVNQELILDNEKAALLLLGYMNANGYDYVEPCDNGVVRNEAVLQHIRRGRESNKAPKLRTTNEVRKDRDPRTDSGAPKTPKPRRVIKSILKKFKSYVKNGAKAVKNAAQIFRRSSTTVALLFKGSPVKSGKEAVVILLKKLLATPDRGKAPYAKKSVIKREYTILRHYLRFVRGGRSGLEPVKRRYRGLAGYLRHKKETDRVRRSKRRFKGLADPNKVILVPPEDIVCKLTYDLDIYFDDILKGDWDLRRRTVLESSLKHRSLHERFVLGLPWKDTELFRSVYAVRLARGDLVRGLDNLSDLAEEYGRQVDGLFANMKRNGFVVARDASGRPKALPHVHIGRNGEFMFGNNGNHRLAMAKILGLKHIPCWVRSRHLLWQQVREEVAAQAANGHSASPMKASLAAHPDLADLLEIKGRDPCARAG